MHKRMHERTVRGSITFAVTLLTAVAVAAAPAAGMASAAARAAAPEGRQPVYEFPVLRQGTEGDVVKVAQRLLGHQGYPTAVDGVFGPRTARQVRQFQAASGLAVTGRIDVKTWEHLVTDASYGDRGEHVRVLQWLLRFYGHRLVVDGIFGPRTERATRAFQRRYDLPVTGVVGLETWRVLVGNVKA